MPTYHSPSSSPSRSPRSSPSPPGRRSRSTRSRNPSRRRHRSPSPSSFSSPSSSYTRSPSRSPSPNSSNRSAKRRLRDKFPDDGLSESKSESIVKTSLVFLGAVGAATLAAHKFWPKGITYGEKEEWECEEKKKERKIRRAAREAAGDDGGCRAESSGRRREARDRERRGNAGGGGADDGRYVAGAGVPYAGSSASSASGRGRDRDGDGRNYRRDEGTSGRGGQSAGGGYYAREEVIVKERGADVGRSRSRPAGERPVDRGRDYRSAERFDAVPAPPAAVVERRTATRREVEYYPPSPPRVTVERSAGSTRDRSRSVVYGREPEVVYVRSDGRYSVAAGSAVDTRPRSRYGDDY